MSETKNWSKSPSPYAAVIGNHSGAPVPRHSLCWMWEWTFPVSKRKSLSQLPLLFLVILHNFYHITLNSKVIRLGLVYSLNAKQNSKIHKMRCHMSNLAEKQYHIFLCGALFYKDQNAVWFHHVPAPFLYQVRDWWDGHRLCILLFLLIPEKDSPFPKKKTEAHQSCDVLQIGRSQRKSQTTGKEGGEVPQFKWILLTDHKSGPGKILRWSVFLLWVWISTFGWSLTAVWFVSQTSSTGYPIISLGNAFNNKQT